MLTPRFSLIITHRTMGHKRGLSNFQMSALTIDRRTGEMLISRACRRIIERLSLALVEHQNLLICHLTSLKLDRKRHQAIILCMRGLKIRVLKGLRLKVLKELLRRALKEAQLRGLKELRLKILREPQPRTLTDHQPSITSLMSGKALPLTSGNGILTASRRHPRRSIRINSIVCALN